jgi:alpha-tubulin suppressor-like RCC1 family protein
MGQVLRRTTAFRMVPAVLLSLASCGGSEPGTGPDSNVVTVSISPNPLTVLAGESRQLVARDQAGRQLSGSVVTWASSASGVATVSAAGLLTGVGDGSATITATAQGKSGNAAVTVFSLAFASVATGGAHTCALTTNGAAYCWGRGESGQLGVSPPASSCSIDGVDYACSLVPVAVQGGLSFTALDAGGEHVCGLTSAGSAYCWGRNNAGQLGDNSTVNRSAPVAVATGLAFVSLSAGALHTCGLVVDGTAYCWGANGRGQLGDGTTANRSVPGPVAGGHSFTMITAGGYSFGHTCALTASGAAYCWGDNGAGQLGIGATDVIAHVLPAPVSGGVTFASLSVGLGNHTCGLTPAGGGYCWGANDFGALGDGSQVLRSAPKAVSGGITFAQIVAGGFIGHSCGRTGSGQAYCWGENEVGAIGDGSLVDRLTPALVAGQLSFISLEAGFRHTCGLDGSAILYCWGSNRAGQLGVNSTSLQPVPTRVVGQRTTASALARGRSGTGPGSVSARMSR